MKLDYPNVDTTNPPEWFKKRAREMSKEEIFERIKHEIEVKYEARQIVEEEIPKLIKYLDVIYSGMNPSTQKRFETWIKRLEEDAK